MGILILVFAIFVNAKDQCTGDSQVRLGFGNGSLDPQLKKCLDNFENPQSKSPTLKSNVSPDQCVTDCNTSAGRSTCAKGFLEDFIKLCKPSTNKCYNYSLCLGAVHTFLKCRSSNSGACTTEARDCFDNCIPREASCQDTKDLKDGRNICGSNGSAAAKVISEEQAKQIIDQRVSETVSGVPSGSQSSLAQTSLFYGNSSAGNAGGTPDNSTPTDNSDPETASKADPQQQPTTQPASPQENPNQNTAQNNGETQPASGGGGGAGGGGSGSGGSGGGSSGSSGGGFAGTGFNDGSAPSDATSGTNGYQATSSSSYKSGSEVAGGGLDSLMTGGDVAARGGRMGPSSFSSGNRGNTSSAGGGFPSMGMGGGSRPSATSGSLRTASVNRNASLDSGGFNAGFHKFSGAANKGSGHKKSYARSRSLNKKKRRSADGNLNLAKLLGRKMFKNGREVSSSSTLPTGVDTGPHVVFKISSSTMIISTWTIRDNWIIKARLKMIPKQKNKFLRTIYALYQSTNNVDK